MCLLPTRILTQVAAVAQAKNGATVMQSYVLSCSFGRSCSRVYLYADEGTKSRISIPRVSTGVIAAADFPHTAGTGTTCATNQVSEGSKCSSEQIHRCAKRRRCFRQCAVECAPSASKRNR